MVSKPQLSKILFTSSTERISFVIQYLIKISVIILRDRANPAAFSRSSVSSRFSFSARADQVQIGIRSHTFSLLDFF